MCSSHARQYNVSLHALNFVTVDMRHYITLHYILSHTTTVQQWAWFYRYKLQSEMKHITYQTNKYKGQFMHTILLE